MSAPETPRRGRRDLLLRRVLPALVAVLAVVAVVLLTRGGGEDDDPGPVAASSGPAATSSAPVTDEPGGTTAPPPETSAPVTQEPAPSVVPREGVDPAERTVTAAPAPFTAPASWSDGATVRLVEARQQVTAGSGPGELAGQPQTVFRLELVNGSAGPLVLDSVVVTATYGADDVAAGPLYDRETADFGGTLAAGQTAAAVYSFAIPSDQLGDVTLSVDVDGRHFPAVFTGAVPV
ncbi:hypothetical protein [Blastococcus sp. SYSU D00820]